MYDEISTKRWEEQEFNREMTRSEVDWLREQVNFLTQELSIQLKEKQELERELAYLNNELADIFRKRSKIDAKHLNFKKVKKLVKILVDNEISIKEALAILLDTVYDQNVTFNELEKKQETLSNCDSSNQLVRLDITANTLVRDNPSNRLKTRNTERFLNQQITTKCKELHARNFELGTQFLMFRAHYTRLKTELTNRQVQEENQQQQPGNLQQSQEREMSTEELPPRL